MCKVRVSPSHIPLSSVDKQEGELIPVPLITGTETYIYLPVRPCDIQPELLINVSVTLTVDTNRPSQATSLKCQQTSTHFRPESTVSMLSELIHELFESMTNYYKGLHVAIQWMVGGGGPSS